MTTGDLERTGPDGAGAAAAEKRPSLLRRAWRRLRSPATGYTLGALLSVGFLAGIVFWGGFNWSLELSNAETFCISCHEMEQNVFREFRSTAHYTNRTGVRATCADCHVPDEWIHKVVRKIRATNELYHHFAGSIATQEKFDGKRIELAKNVWRTMKRTDSRECRNCHNLTFMDLSQQENRAAELHQKALQTGGTCIDCHKGIAHRLPPGAAEAAAEVESEFPRTAAELSNFLGRLGDKNGAATAAERSPHALTSAAQPPDRAGRR